MALLSEHSLPGLATKRAPDFKRGSWATCLGKEGGAMVHIFASRKFCYDVTAQENNSSSFLELTGTVI